MYKVEWDTETGGVILNNKETDETLGIAPRPVFYEELNLLGLDKLGWSYPNCAEPIMWAINKQYFYRGLHIFDAKGADIYTKPSLEFCNTVKPQALLPVDMETMLSKVSDWMFVLENEAIEFIRDVYTTYVKVNDTYNKADSNKIDFESLVEKVGKYSKKQMAVVKQTCDSFDIMPLETAKDEGKRVLLSTRIDYFIASFSGGKDAQVVLDLCTRAIPPTDFEVIYSDTGHELPSSLSLYEETQHTYNIKFPSLKFHLVRNHESVLNYWDKIGTPSDTHRWCCSIMKTAPIYKFYKEKNGKRAKTLTFDGVRAEESTRREDYRRIGKGKHTFTYNAHPILRWNSTEIFLYLFRYQLPMNSAYRAGKARIGCLICPFSSTWDDMFSNHFYADSLTPFVEKLKKFADQSKIDKFDEFLCKRNWKVKAMGDREQVLPKVFFPTDTASLIFVAEIKNAKQSVKSWLPALCPHTIMETKDGYTGELRFKDAVYPYNITVKDDLTSFKVNGNLDASLIILLRRLAYKAAYCVNCEVCEVDCPTGALTICPNVTINKDKCTNCHKCLMTHDRGCIAADCIRMINDTEKKLGTKVQGYKTFGLRDEWIDEYFVEPENFWKENSLGTAQVDSVKAWLRDAEITDTHNNITPLGTIMREIYKDDSLLFWEIAFINLSYNSFIVQWVCENIDEGQIYNKNYIREEIANAGYAGSLTTIENAATAFIDMAKKSPVGNDLQQGVTCEKAGLMRCSYNDLSPFAVAYSIYRYASEKGLNMFRVSSFYNPTENHGVYKEFRISKDALYKKLRALTANKDRVLVAELNMGLEHITLREDLTPLKILEYFGTL